MFYNDRPLNMNVYYVKDELSQFNHPTRLTILRWHLFVWVDLCNGVMELSTILKGITTLPQHGLETLSAISHPPHREKR